MKPTALPGKKDIRSSLRIVTPAHESTIVLALEDSPVNSTTSESDSLRLPSPIKARSSRNAKKLSLTLPPSTCSSTSSLSIASDTQQPTAAPPPQAESRRRPSVISLPTTSTATSFLRANEESGSPTVPYADGPIEILPNIWLGSEDNARDWRGLAARGIKSILNVAKEVNCPFETTTNSTRQRSMSTTDLYQPAQEGISKYYPGHVPTGRPGTHYLKLAWSHGQPDLVESGFSSAFAFVDEALARNEGVLVHCQCGISRSGTMIIALVMRAAARRSNTVPPEVWECQGMQGAYSYVKEKSKHVGPNMSLIYQLLDYERALRKSGSSSPTPSDRSSFAAAEDEEWSRKRAMMDESDGEDYDRNSVEVVREAQALDKAMEDRMRVRKASTSSTGSGIGMGVAWKSKYAPRNRAGSVASNRSFLTEHLVEEDEEQELLGVGGGFDEDNLMPSPESQLDDDARSTLSSKKSFSKLPPPSAPATRSTFALPPVPPTASRSSFDLTPRAKAHPKLRTRPAPLSLLPTVPSSPVAVNSAQPYVPPSRPERRKQPPFQIRSTPPGLFSQPASTPSQTLFVFPPSPTNTARAPSTMVLTPSVSEFVPFPSLNTPRAIALKTPGRRMSFFGIQPPATPTTAYSRVDARGWVGMN